MARHSQAWHDMHDAALAEHRREKALGTIGGVTVFPNDLRDAPQVTFVQDRAHGHADRSQHFRQTGERD